MASLFCLAVKRTRYKICQSQNQQRKLKISIHQIFCPQSPCKEAVHYPDRCSCFVSCIPRVYLASFYWMLISFLQYSVSYLHCTKNNRQKTQSLAEPTPTKRQIECFLFLVFSQGRTLIFMGSIYILLGRNGIRQDDHHDQSYWNYFELSK